MVGRLILGLIWLTCVHSETMKNMPTDESSMAGKSSTTMSDNFEGLADLSKSKRYLSHQHSSACPPFYPHFGMHVPMHATRPYGPPSYPKNDLHVPIFSHQPLQFLHQPSYSSYVPKQTVHYVKEEIPMPIYHQPIASPPIHVQAIKPIFKQAPPSYHHYQQPTIEHKISYEKQPVFAYAPAYHKPMPIFWQGPEIKKIEYPINQVSHQKPTIVYKSEAPKCAPCPTSQPQPFHHPPQPMISYAKVAPPIHQATHSPTRIYLPASVHQPIAKPCDK